MPHPVAIEGFSADPARYESGRPGYPDEAIAAILEFAGDVDLIVDLGAGTGKLTRRLISADATVVAVDPVAAMTRLIPQSAPSAHVVTGVAEALPFRDAGVDCVTVAQAAHWFDADRAWPELERVIRPGGTLAILANIRLREVAWVDALWSLMDEAERDAPWKQPGRTPMALPDGFAPPIASELRHRVPMTEDSVIARLSSVSHIAMLDAIRRDEFERRAREIVGAVSGPLEIEYRTDLSLFRRS